VLPNQNHLLHSIKSLLKVSQYCLTFKNLSNQYTSMSDKFKLTKKDIQKILSCQNTLRNSLENLSTTTKKLNATSVDLEKKLSGVPKYQKNTPYEKNDQNNAALQYANNEIDKITQQFLKDIKIIEQNLGILNSQEIYLKRINELVEYYKKNISDDKLEIEKDTAKKSIANRLSTFYNANENTAKTVNKYTIYVYWTIFGLVSLILLYNAAMGGALTMLYHKSVDVVAKGIKVVKGVKVAKETTVAKNKPKTSVLVGGSKYSLQPWIIILFALLLGYFIIVPHIIKPFSPYIMKYGVYILITIFLILLGDFFMFRFLTKHFESKPESVDTKVETKVVPKVETKVVPKVETKVVPKVGPKVVTFPKVGPKVEPDAVKPTNTGFATPLQDTGKQPGFGNSFKNTGKQPGFGNSFQDPERPPDGPTFFPDENFI